MDFTRPAEREQWAALERLLRAENGGWDQVDLWNVDAAIADDMLTVVRLIRESHRYPGDLGFGEEIAAVWRLWRAGQAAAGPEPPAR